MQYTNTLCMKIVEINLNIKADASYMYQELKFSRMIYHCQSMFIILIPIQNPNDETDHMIFTDPSIINLMIR